MSYTPTPEEATERYRKSGCNNCPKCDADALQCGSFEADGTSVWRDVECNECGFNFLEVFEFSNVDIADQ